MVEKLAMDVQLIHVRAIHTLVQQTANGLNGNHGHHVRRNVVAEPKIEQEWFAKNRQMEVRSAREKQPPLGIATRKNVQSTVNGADGVNMIRALKRAEEECTEGFDPYYKKKDMEESHVQDPHSKWKDVACKHAQFVKTVQDMPDSVQHGSHIVLLARSSKDVAGNPADCVNMIIVHYNKKFHLYKLRNYF